MLRAELSSSAPLHAAGGSLAAAFAGALLADDVDHALLGVLRAKLPLAAAIDTESGPLVAPLARAPPFGAVYHSRDGVLSAVLTFPAAFHAVRRDLVTASVGTLLAADVHHTFGRVLRAKLALSTALDAVLRDLSAPPAHALLADYIYHPFFCMLGAELRLSVAIHAVACLKDAFGARAHLLALYAFPRLLDVLGAKLALAAFLDPERGHLKTASVLALPFVEVDHILVGVCGAELAPPTAFDAEGRDFRAAAAGAPVSDRHVTLSPQHAVDLQRRQSARTLGVVGAAAVLV